MSELRVIKEDTVADLLDAVQSATKRLVAPVVENGRHVFAWVDRAENISVPEVSTVNSIKEFFFPNWEVLLAFGEGVSGAEVHLPKGGAEPFVVFGARPCDAAGLAILDALFEEDTPDPTWRANRDAATVVAIGCRSADVYCFCTSVGLAPDSRSGADVLLVPTADEEYIAEAVTPKGEEFLTVYAPFFRSVSSASPQVAQVPVKFASEALSGRLENAFESDVWADASERCLGCAVCTYYCPTCHCFGIEDEADAGRGIRARCWDSCSFAHFTRHASGHNPRGDVATRWRQRIMHKFAYYPALFAMVSCTGCGRCGRLCPVDLGVEETLVELSEDRL